MAISGEPPIRVHEESFNVLKGIQEDWARDIAKEAAREVLGEYRSQQKRGRSDQGRGSSELGTILSEARERLHLTQDQVADATGLHPTTIGKIETGDRGMSMTTFAKLCGSYDIEFIDEVITYYASL